MTVPITPRRDGPNLIHARITDAYGNSSECGLVYTFTVAPPADPVSYFPLDEGQGGTASDVMDSGRIATSSGDIGWTRGRVGAPTGDSYRLEGAGLDTTGGERLSTQGPVINTDEAFSVSAWVRLDESDPSRAYTAVGQDGERHSGFYLGYQHTQGGRWIFKQAPYDGDDTAISERVLSTEPAQTGAWTHLLGTYDPENEELTLYVDGVKQGTHVQKTAWNAEGPFVIGGAKYRGSYHDFWPGAIDDVRVWDRVVFDEPFIETEEARSEVWELANRPIALEGRWRLDETEGTVAADASDHGLDATLEADPLTAWNQAMNDVTFAPGVSLDVTAEEHLHTNGPALRTDRSYSVAAWVRLDEVGHNSTAVAQNGTDHSAFYLSYQHTLDYNSWVMKLPPEDRTGASGWHRSLSEHSPQFGKWTHLAATYDHTLGEATLFVDGVPQEPVEVPQAWHANGPVIIGGARFEKEFFDPWAGDISDVHLYQGVISEDDLTQIRLGFLPEN